MSKKVQIQNKEMVRGGQIYYFFLIWPNFKDFILQVKKMNIYDKNPNHQEKRYTGGQVYQIFRNVANDPIN